MLARIQAAPHKPECDPLDWERCNPKLLILAAFYLDFCEKHKIPILFTSIIRSMIPGVSKSHTHDEGRAFDFSVHGWTTDLIDEFLDLARKSPEVQKIGAITASGSVVAFLFHDGTSFHGHAQVRRGI